VVRFSGSQQGGRVAVTAIKSGDILQRERALDVIE
jgi:hypothetical protein